MVKLPLLQTYLIVSLLVLLSSCSWVNAYQPPVGIAHGTLSFDYHNEGNSDYVVSLSIRDDGRGKAIKQNVAVISDGNPLVKTENQPKMRFPAGVDLKFRVSAVEVGGQAIPPSCDRLVTFQLAANQHSQLLVNVSQSKTCTIQLMDAANIQTL